MVYITSWDEFLDRSEQLFRADPDSTRYVMKYRHCDGKLVLKVTDNKEVSVFFVLFFFFRLRQVVLIAWVYRSGTHWCSFDSVDNSFSHLMNCFTFCQCLKFKTDQAQDAKKMEKLNNLFFTLMSRGPDADVTEVAGKEQTEAPTGKKGRGRKQ
ncbi:hypothetical protein Tsubulata_047365 [Turnera subulata]|uniref:SRP9 domain-containing protein n=1 Tax=Turnera subulata TaxID=218843 RepID=A0A9Q0JBM8_9ROSI|nr:hypothetical protein Tsubulata_047365 [Turnera subulata]